MTLSRASHPFSHRQPRTHTLSPLLPLPQGRPMKKALATVSRLGLINPQEATAMQLLTERVSALKESLQVRARSQEKDWIDRAFTSLFSSCNSKLSLNVSRTNTLHPQLPSAPVHLPSSRPFSLLHHPSPRSPSPFPSASPHFYSLITPPPPPLLRT
jgi:hypothetical protein